MYETFGRTVIEAAAKATPAIVSDIGALRELVVPGVTGLLFQPGSPASLARSISELLADQELSRWMGSNARRRFESQFSPDAAYTRLIDIYSQLAPSAVCSETHATNATGKADA
jgi:glycosyltransferase involved in cell wall biosynthesis